MAFFVFLKNNWSYWSIVCNVFFLQSFSWSLDNLIWWFVDQTPFFSYLPVLSYYCHLLFKVGSFFLAHQKFFLTILLLFQWRFLWLHEEKFVCLLRWEFLQITTQSNTWAIPLSILLNYSILSHSHGSFVNILRFQVDFFLFEHLVDLVAILNQAIDHKSTAINRLSGIFLQKF